MHHSFRCSFVGAALTLAATIGLLPAARADVTAVKVAVVNGQPIYHSKILVSRVPDDIDRALLLQQYEKNPDLMLPVGMDDATYRKILNDSYKGDEAKLVRELKSKGITLDEYKRFITEELILAAMLSHFDKQIKNGWLVDLRRGSVIEKMR